MNKFKTDLKKINEILKLKFKTKLDLEQEAQYIVTKETHPGTKFLINTPFNTSTIKNSITYGSIGNIESLFNNGKHRSAEYNIIHKLDLIDNLFTFKTNVNNYFKLSEELKIKIDQTNPKKYTYFIENLNDYISITHLSNKTLTYILGKFLKEYKTIISNISNKLKNKKIPIKIKDNIEEINLIYNNIIQKEIDLNTRNEKINKEIENLNKEINNLDNTKIKSSIDKIFSNYIQKLIIENKKEQILSYSYKDFINNKIFVKTHIANIFLNNGVSNFDTYFMPKNNIISNSIINLNKSNLEKIIYNIENKNENILNNLIYYIKNNKNFLYKKILNKYKEIYIHYHELNKEEKINLKIKNMFKILNKDIEEVLKIYINNFLLQYFEKEFILNKLETLNKDIIFSLIQKEKEIKDKNYLFNDRYLVDNLFLNNQIIIDIFEKEIKAYNE